MKLYLAILLIVIFIVLLQLLKSHKQKFTNYIKNTDIIDNINLNDSIVHIATIPKDECIKRNTVVSCLADDKCRVRERNNPQNEQETIKECVSRNDINIENDLIVNNHIYLGTDIKRKIDINTLRRIKNMPVHFNKSININNPQETICLTNGSIDLPRCVQDDAGNFYIKLKGKDETSDHGYDAAKDCKYKIQNSDNKTNIDSDDFNNENNSFKSLISCNTFLKDNYDNIKSANTSTNNSCGNDSAVTKTDTNYSCIQKHHIEMLDGKRPISLRSFASIMPFTFFRKRFNEPPYFSRGIDDTPDFDVAPPSKKGPMSANISKNYKLISYSEPNYQGKRRVYRYPGVKDVSGDMPNGIRSYKVEHDTTPADKLKHVCLTRADQFESINSWNENPSKKNVYIPEPCSYDNPYQMFYMEFNKGNLSSDGHRHPHFHKGSEV